MERTLDREFKGRKLDKLEAWHVFMIAVDPDHQGSGMIVTLFYGARFSSLTIGYPFRLLIYAIQRGFPPRLAQTYSPRRFETKEQGHLRALRI